MKNPLCKPMYVLSLALVIVGLVTFGVWRCLCSNRRLQAQLLLQQFCSCTRRDG